MPVTIFHALTKNGDWSFQSSRKVQKHHKSIKKKKKMVQMKKKKKGLREKRGPS